MSSKIRLGFTCANFSRHSVGWLSRWLIEAIDRDKFEIYLWQIGGDRDDTLHEWFQLQAAELGNGNRAFYNCHSAPVQDVARHIQERAVDVLIDLDSITQSNVPTLYATPNLAELTASWLGWDAMGIENLMITDPLVSPVGSEDYYTPALLRLPCYVAVRLFEYLDGGSPYTRRSLRLPADAVVMAAIQKPSKNSAEYIQSVMRVLRGCDAYLVIKATHNRVIECWHQWADIMGVDKSRLRFVEFLPSELQNRATLRLWDLVLDSFPYNGCTTTLEALWAETPIVSLEGTLFTARQGYALLNHAGIGELCAASVQEYEEKAIALANDRARLLSYRGILHSEKGRSPLWDVERFTRNFEAGIEKALEMKGKG